jgi:hypothetical protein
MYTLLFLSGLESWHHLQQYDIIFMRCSRIVLTVAVPVVVTALTPKNADINFAYQAALADVIHVLITNGGNRPGSVRQVLTLRIVTSHKNPYNYLLYGVNGSIQPLVMAPQQSALLSLMHKTTDEDFVFPDPEQIRSATLCSLYALTTDFHGVTAIKDVSLPCAELVNFMIDINSDIVRYKQLHSAG